MPFLTISFKNPAEFCFECDELTPGKHQSPRNYHYKLCTKIQKATTCEALETDQKQTHFGGESKQSRLEQSGLSILAALVWGVGCDLRVVIENHLSDLEEPVDRAH